MFLNCFYLTGLMPNNLDRVKSSLELEENSDFRERVFGTFLENPESAANMIVEFASSKLLMQCQHRCKFYHQLH